MYYIYTKVFGTPRIFVVHEDDLDRFDCTNKKLFALAFDLSDAIAIVQEHFIVSTSQKLLRHSYVF